MKQRSENAVKDRPVVRNLQAHGGKQVGARVPKNKWISVDDCGHEESRSGGDSAHGTERVLAHGYSRRSFIDVGLSIQACPPYGKGWRQSRSSELLNRRRIRAGGDARPGCLAEAQQNCEFGKIVHRRSVRLMGEF